MYRRALASTALGDFVAAAGDLERVIAIDPKYDYQRAAGLLAHAYARTDRPDKTDAHFTATLETSTLS